MKRYNLLRRKKFVNATFFIKFYQLSSFNTLAVTLLLVFISPLWASAQSNTDDLLDASKAKDFVQLWPDFKGKRFLYEIDQSKGTRFAKKIPPKLTVAVRKRDQSINITIGFFNPLAFSISSSDTLLVDPSFQAIESFVTALAGAFKEINTQFNSSPTALGTTKTALLATANSTPANSLALTGMIVQNDIKEKAVNTVLKLKSGELAEWGYLSITGNIDCVNWDGSSVTNLVELDGIFTNPAFNNDILNKVKDLKSSTNVSDFQRKLAAFSDAIETEEAANSANSAKITAFATLIKGSNFLAPSGSNNICQAFEHYSRVAFSRFLDDCRTKQLKREKLIEVAKKLKDNLVSVVETASEAVTEEGNTKENWFIIGRFEILNEKLHEVTVTMHKRKVDFDSDPPVVADLDEKITAIIRIRSYQSLIPEFSTGAYFSTLVYPIYNAKVTTTTDANGKQQTTTTVDPTVAEERYPVVIAGMLNLSVNNFNGFVHPLIQLGVGTGKNRPAILLGGGFRIRYNKPVVITFGTILAWKKELNTLKLGDIIEGQATIDKDLTYKGFWEPKFYTGLQYNF